MSIERDDDLDGENADLKAEIAELRQEIRNLRDANVPRGTRYRSETAFFGLPLVSIATGPDPKNHEIRGHARGIIAIGDIATGFLAIGGLARGVIAIGGGAIGILALGGGAVGALALGGGAIGLVAIGGGAIGYVAFGGGAIGVYTLDAMRQNPGAVKLLDLFLPGLADMLKQKM